MYTYGIESPDVQYAYITITEFFDAYGLESALHYTRKTLKRAGSYRYWRGDPSNALHFLEKLEALLMAALTLHREGSVREAAMITLTEGEAPSITAYGQYCGWHRNRSPWHFFPRSLTVAEYANPYLVIKKVAAKGGRKKWRALLRELQFFTLSTSCLNESEDVDLNTLQLYRLLTKLIEAAHLIDVRAIAEIGGELRPKWTGAPQPPTDAADSTNQTTGL